MRCKIKGPVVKAQNYDGDEQLLSSETYEICGFVEVKSGIVDSVTCAVLADQDGNLTRVRYDKIKIIATAIQAGAQRDRC